MFEFAKQHIDLQHNQTDGWITVAHKESGIFKQKHIQISNKNALDKYLSEWQAEDIYLSQNSFFIPRRRIDTIREIRSLFTDLDCYNLKHSPDPYSILRLLEMDCFNVLVPDPNYVTFSGRGLILHWLIEPCRNFSIPRWNRLQKYFCHILREYGADPMSIDAARVFRLAGSVNSKSGKTVQIEIRHSYRYTLDELESEYLPSSPVAKSKQKVRGYQKFSQGKVSSLFNLHTLHYERLSDLHRLINMRNGDLEGYREQVCFFYRYWSCCYTLDPEEAFRQTLDLNSQFLNPLPEHEVRQATKSAEKRFHKLSIESDNLHANQRGYPNAGYNFTNSKIIENLGITENEQRQLKTIISTDEKYRRNNLRRQEISRKEGKPTRQEYLVQEEAKTSLRVEMLRSKMSENPRASNRELGDMLGVSESYIRNLRKKHL